jgi:quinol-cytochrome oxidoreductase complex cytochrome b subunit
VFSKVTSYLSILCGVLDLAGLVALFAGLVWIDWSPVNSSYRPELTVISMVGIAALGLLLGIVGFTVSLIANRGQDRASTRRSIIGMIASLVAFVGAAVMLVFLIAAESRWPGTLKTATRCIGGGILLTLALDVLSTGSSVPRTHAASQARRRGIALAR